jgi:hypothetical protein
MTDFLSSLVERSFGTPAAIRPRLALLFEPSFPNREPAADISSRREVDPVSHAPERDPVRPAAERRDDRVPDGAPPRRVETEGRPARVQDMLLTIPAEITGAAPHAAGQARPVAVKVKEEAERPRDVLRGDIRRENVAPVPPGDRVPATSPSADRAMQAPPEITTRTEDSGRDQKGGLLVPSKVGARIAADLHSVVSATNAASRNRTTAAGRASETHRPGGEGDVHVTIGRIEVRAAESGKAPVRDRHASPVMGLDEYLRRQSRRGGQ